MVQLSHSGANEDRVNEILLAAQKRFGMYGFGKTTMHEIADDLGISKASLYYYFPDKDTLFREVFKKEKQDYIDALHGKVIQNDNPLELIEEYVNLRMVNFRAFFNLSRAGIDEMKGIKNVIKDLWGGFLEKEKEEIRLIFQKGVEKKVFEIENIPETAGLFIDSLRGITHIYLYHKDITYLNDEEYNTIGKTLKQYTAIFIKGISA